eukprot:SAG22_NODE_1716_length_3746_cov_1.332602_2_plen_112_part_00
MVLELSLQRGFLYAAVELVKLVFTGAPIFFLFQVVWKNFIFLEALTVPAAQYRATGRGVVLKRMEVRTHPCVHMTSGPPFSPRECIAVAARNFAVLLANAPKRTTKSYVVH